MYIFHVQLITSCLRQLAHVICNRSNIRKFALINTVFRSFKFHILKWHYALLMINDMCKYLYNFETGVVCFILNIVSHENENENKQMDTAASFHRQNE